MIEVEGKKYKVVESLGYVHDVGMYAKVVKLGDAERIAVKDGGVWRWWKPIVLPRGPIKAEY